MNKTDILIGYKTETFIKQKEFLILQINSMIKSKQKKITRSTRYVQKYVRNSTKYDNTLYLSNGIIISVSALLFSNIAAGNSYVLSLGCPLLVSTSLFIERKLNEEKQEIYRNYENKKDIYAYLELISFINGEPKQVLKLQAIADVCYRDNFVKPLRLLSRLNDYNEDDIVYVEELCTDFDLEKKRFPIIKKLTNDKLKII